MRRYREIGEMKEESRAHKRFRLDAETGKDEEESEQVEKLRKSWKKVDSVRERPVGPTLGTGLQRTGGC